MNRPFLVPIILFLSGIAVAKSRLLILHAAGMPIAVILLALPVLLAGLFIKKALPFYLLVYFFFFLLGAVRYSDAVIAGEDGFIKNISRVSQNAVVYGTIVDDPTLKGSFFGSRLVFPVRADKALIGSREYDFAGGVLLNLYRPSGPFEAGDKVIASGKIFLPRSAQNPYAFDYSAHLKDQGIDCVINCGKGDYCVPVGSKASPFLTIKRIVYRIRGHCSVAFDKYLRGDTRAIVKPLILGTRSETDGRLNDLFIRTGTMHIIAVSGLHVTFVAVTVLGLLKIMNCPVKTAYFLTIALICAYAVFTGSQPSAMRAALMGGLMLAALAAERKTALIDTLALSAFLITFLDPGQLFRPGFILSYVAVLSIIYVAPLTDKLFVRGDGKRPVSPISRITVYAARSFSLSLGVWIGMMPVIAGYFRMITPSGILANLIAVPLFYLVMLLGFVLMFAGPISFLAPFSWVISRALDFILAFYVAVLEKIVAVPCAFVKVPALPVPLFCVYYAVLSGIIVSIMKNYQRKKLLIIFLVFAAVLFVWSEVFRSDHGNLRITFYDVGKADAALIETPGGDILVDGGSDKAGDGGAGRNVLEPYLLEEGRRKIDCVILSHAHEDHIGGLLYLIKVFETGTIIDCVSSPEKGSAAALYTDLTSEIKKKRIKHFGVKRGDRVSGPGGTKLMIFNPSDKRLGDENGDSMVFKLVTMKNGSILFCGDATSQSMEEMLSFGGALRSEIIKIPHHGSGLGDMNIVSEFLGYVRPRYAVITAKNRSEVNAALLDILARLGTKVFITGETGAVIADETAAGWRVRGFRDDPQMHTADP